VKLSLKRVGAEFDEGWMPRARRVGGLESLRRARVEFAGDCVNRGRLEWSFAEGRSRVTRGLKRSLLRVGAEFVEGWSGVRRGLQ